MSTKKTYYSNSKIKEKDAIKIFDDALSQKTNWQTIKKNKRNIIAKNEKKNIYLKTFSLLSLNEKAKRIFSGGRAVRTLKGTDLLIEAGCLAPTVLACGSYSDHDFVLMEDLKGPQLLNALESFLQGHENRPWRRQLFRALGHTIGRMHANKVVHGDLRPNNVIIHPGNNGYRLGLIDNERTRRPVRFTREQKRNLKQIMLLDEDYISPAERRRFFAAYFQQLSLSRPQQRRLYRQTLASVQEHFRRRGVSRGTEIAEQDWQVLANQQPDYS